MYAVYCKIICLYPHILYKYYYLCTIYFKFRTFKQSEAISYLYDKAITYGFSKQPADTLCSHTEGIS